MRNTKRDFLVQQEGSLQDVKLPTSLPTQDQTIGSSDIKKTDSKTVFTKRLYHKIRIGIRHTSTLFHRLYSHLPPFMRTVWFSTLTAVLVFSTCSYLVIQLISAGRYRVSDDVKAMIGKSTVDRQLIKDTDKAIAYNRADEDSPKDIQKVMQLAAAKEDSTGKKPYNATLAKNPKDGITFGDTAGDRSFTITPLFGIGSPQLDTDGRAIYPSGSDKHIYSFKTNGIKSDIVITQQPKQNTKAYTWQLNIPNTLEAKQLPNGGIGIYSADQTLFNNLQVGDDKSQQLVDKARQNSKKDTLVFELPAPFITTTQSKKNYDDVDYKLTKQSDKTYLTLNVRNLKNQQYPLSIDPTITVTTTSDFQQQTGDTGNTDFGTDGQIQRSITESGAIAATWTATNSILTARYGHATVVYNGFMYVLGGCSVGSAGCTTFLNDVQYAPINTDGTVGAWHYTHASTDDNTSFVAGFTTGRVGHKAVAYNGNMYITGGCSAGTTCTTFLNDTQFAPINSDGTVGNWTSTSTIITGRTDHAMTAYNGYLYITGGCSAGACTTFLNDVQYAPVNGDGTVGAWHYTHSSTDDSTSFVAGFTTARFGHSTSAYNGYIYVLGGCSAGNCTTALNTTYYAPINSNGTVGDWVATTTMPTTRYSFVSTIYKGYVYLIGGCTTATCAGKVTSTDFATINSDGSINTWYSTSAIPTGISGAGLAIYNGYIFTIGGCSSGSCTTFQSVVRSAQFGGGRTSFWPSGSSILVARYGQASVAYNGYLYVTGGCTAGAAGCSTFKNDVQYAPINPNGSLGTWHYTHDGLDDGVGYVSGFTTARYNHTAVAYQGYLYILGGCSAGTSCTTLLSDVQYAQLDPSGVVGTWQATTSFLAARHGHTTEVYKGYLYVMGGCTSGSCSTYVDSVQYAPIDSFGAVGAWHYTHNSTDDSTTYVAGFGTARTEHTSAVYNGYIYVLGGIHATSDTACNATASTLCSDVLIAQINSNGTVGSWTATTSFATARQQHSTVINNGYIYVLGGCSSGACTTFQSDVQFARINSDGTVGSWTATLSFAVARNNLSAVASRGFLYMLAGCSSGNCSVFESTTMYTNIGPIRTIASATRQTSAFTTARYEHTSVTYNGYLYIIGGYNGTTRQNDIQYCPFNSDASIGTCTQQTNAFTTARSAHTSVVYNGYLYIIGGYSGSYLNDIQYCPINSNGSVGTCTQQTNAFTTARSAHSSVVHNGYLYIIGGNNGGFLNDIQYCPINSNGSVGTCTQQTSAFTTSRHSHSSVVHNGYLYIIGGYDSGNNTLSDVQFCPLNSDGSVGSCSLAGVLSQPNMLGNAVADNGTLYILSGSVTSGTPSDSMQYCAFEPNGVLGSCMLNSPVYAFSRYSHSAVVYKGYIYTIGGYSNPTVYDDIYRIPALAQANLSQYERYFDTGSGGNNITSFTVNGSAKCNFTASYKTADNGGVYGTATTLLNVVPGVAQSVAVANKRYVWISITSNDTFCGGVSTITDILLNYNYAPTAPTLVVPSNGLTAVSTLPEFRMGSTDEPLDYLRYKIEICSTSNCSSIVRTIDQTSSQTGWTGQSVQGGTAYTAGSPLTQVAIHQYQAPALTANTQYWWRAYAIDPGGTNTWSAASSIYSFTTQLATAPTVNIRGNVNIGGNVIIKP